VPPILSEFQFAARCAAIRDMTWFAHMQSGFCMFNARILSYRTRVVATKLHWSRTSNSGLHRRRSVQCIDDLIDAHILHRVIRMHVFHWAILHLFRSCGFLRPPVSISIPLLVSGGSGDPAPKKVFFS